MKFKIDASEAAEVTDEEISEILTLVYVESGYTSKEVAKKVFEPSLVRSRGRLIIAREELTMKLAGMVIVVPPNSIATVRAKSNECEIHLLGVKPTYRGCGLGRSLVTVAVSFAKESGWSKIILWTQKSMKEAQSLYESVGFIKTDEMHKNGIDFLVYEKKST